MEQPKRRAGDVPAKPEEIVPYKPPVIISGFDRWLRIALFVLNCSVLFVMLWVLANVDRNYRFGTGNRDLNCATARDIQQQFPDPELHYVLDKYCK